MTMPTQDDITKAVALYYDGNNSPVVTAKGQDQVAQEIIAIANQNNIPLCDNALLIELLYQLELGDNIPEHLYKAIAHILAFAYQMDTLCLKRNSN